MPELTIGEDCEGWRLDRFVKRSLPGMPLSHIFKLFRTGKVRLDGRKAAVYERIKAGQTVIVHIPEERFGEASGTPGAKPRGRVLPPFVLEIIFEDVDLIAISKPAGVPVHPGSGYAAGTCIDRIIEHLKISRGTGSFIPALVHRLDAGTSGVLLVAKNYKALRALSRAFQMRRVEKRYLALAAGVLQQHAGIIELPVSRLDGPDRIRDPRIGVTEYKVIGVSSRPPTGAPEVRFSLLELKILTGRTHQIRSHLKDMGAPIVGDDLYGDTAINGLVREAAGLKRQFLHAAAVSFKHPIGGAAVVLRAALPPDLKSTLSWAGLKEGTDG
jgi:23S rRNA pseudouridine955/2504/2580 synthase